MNTSMSKENKGKDILSTIVGLIAVVIVFIVINVIVNVVLGGAQTVQIYSFETISGDKVIFGFDRGRGGVFSKWNMTIDEDMNILVNDNGEKKVSGYISGVEYIKQNQSRLESEGAEKIVSEAKGKKVIYSVYKIDNRYLCIGYFVKTDDIGYFLWTEDDIDQEEAVDLYAKFRGTRGFGYWFSKIVSELLDD